MSRRVSIQSVDNTNSNTNTNSNRNERQRRHSSVSNSSLYDIEKVSSASASSYPPRMSVGLNEYDEDNDDDGDDNNSSDSSDASSGSGSSTSSTSSSRSSSSSSPNSFLNFPNQQYHGSSSNRKSKQQQHSSSKRQTSSSSEKQKKSRKSKRRGSSNSNSSSAGSGREINEQHQQSSSSQSSKNKNKTSSSKEYSYRNGGGTIDTNKKYDLEVYFRELAETVPVLTELEIHHDQQQQKQQKKNDNININDDDVNINNTTKRMLQDFSYDDDFGLDQQQTGGDSHRNKNQKLLIRDLLMSHAIIVETLSSQLPIDEEISGEMFKSIAESGTSEASRLRVEFLQGSKSAMVAMRVLTHLAILGGKQWREKHRAAELDRAATTISNLGNEVTMLKSQLNEAQKEISALQSVVNENRIQSHRQLLEFEMKRREFQEEIAKQNAAMNMMSRNNNTSNMNAQQMEMAALQQQQQFKNRKNIKGRGAVGFDPSTVFSDTSGDENNSSEFPLITRVDSGMSEDSSFSNEEDGLINFFDTSGSANAPFSGENTWKRSQQQQQQKSQTHNNSIFASSINAEVASEGSFDLNDNDLMNTTTTTSRNKKEPPIGMLSWQGPFAKKLDGSSSSINKKQIKAPKNNAARYMGLTQSLTPTPQKKQQQQQQQTSPTLVATPIALKRLSTTGTGTTSTTGGKRRSITFSPDTHSSSSASTSFLTGVKDMLGNLIPERNKIGAMEEEALADLEEAEIVHGHVSDITGEAPPSELKVVRKFARKKSASQSNTKATAVMSMKNNNSNSTTNDVTVPEVLFQRPPPVPDAKFCEEIFSALRTLQVGSFHGTDDSSSKACVESEQVVEYLNEHFPSLEDLLSSVEDFDRNTLQQQKRSNKNKQSCVVEFVQEYVPINRTQFANILLRVVRNYC